MAEISPVRLNLNYPGQNLIKQEDKNSTPAQIKETPPAPQTIPPSEVIRGNNYTLTTVAGMIHSDASPVIDDLDGDGKKEVIFLSDAYDLHLPEGNHLIYVLNSDGTVKNGWPRANPTNWGWYFPSNCTVGDFHPAPGKEVILPNWAGIHFYKANGELLKELGGDNVAPAIISNFINAEKQVAVNNGHRGETYIIDANLNYVGYGNFITLTAADINNDGQAELIGYRKTNGYAQADEIGIYIEKHGNNYILRTSDNYSFYYTINNVNNYSDFYLNLPLNVKQAFPQGSEREQALKKAFEGAEDLKVHVTEADGVSIPGWPVEISTNDFQMPYANSGVGRIDLVSGDINKDGKEEIFFTFRDGGQVKLFGFDKNGRFLSGWYQKSFPINSDEPQKIFLANVLSKDRPDAIFYLDYYVYVFNFQGGIVKAIQLNSNSFPLFVDVNLDGRSEAIYPKFAEKLKWFAFDFVKNQELEIFRPSAEVALYPYNLVQAVGDLNSDGFLEIVCGFNEYEGNKPIPKILIAKTGIRANPLPGLDWPMLHNNPGRTNSQPRLPVITAVRHWDKYK